MAENPGDKEWGYRVTVSDDGRLAFVNVRKNSGRRNGQPVSEPQWQTVVPEAKEALVGATAVGGRFILRYLRDASTLVRIHAADGALQREPPLPGVGTAGGFGGRWQDSETF